MFALKRLALAGAVGALFAPAAGAATLDFDFSFDNPMEGGGLVIGVIRGLQDNATGAATSVEVLSNASGAFGIGEYVGTPAQNTWTVADGEITVFQFRSFRGENEAPFVTDASLGMENDSGVPAAGLVRDDGVATAAAVGLTFSLRSDPAVIPLPPAGWLLLGGLGVLAGLGAGRRRRG